MIEVTVIPEDGEPFEVTITSRDVRMWEKAGKGRRIDPQMGVSYSDLYELTWRALRRTSKYDGEFSEFADAHDLEVADESTVDPTSGGR